MIGDLSPLLDIEDLADLAGLALGFRDEDLRGLLSPVPAPLLRKGYLVLGVRDRPLEALSLGARCFCGEGEAGLLVLKSLDNWRLLPHEIMMKEPSASCFFPPCLMGLEDEDEEEEEDDDEDEDEDELDDEGKLFRGKGEQ